VIKVLSREPNFALRVKVNLKKTGLRAQPSARQIFFGEKFASCAAEIV
jgi:hypothetical protein